MRVLYVDLEREWRGGQSQALLTLRGLRERGHEVALLAARDAPLATRSREAGIAVHQVPELGLRAWAAAAIRRLLAHRNFDVVHLNEPHALTAAWLAGSHRRVPTVFSRRVAYPLGRSLPARKRYGIVRRMISISEFVARSLRDSGIPPEKIEIVYEGVEVPPPTSLEARQHARQRWCVREKEFLFGCVGYLLPEKGQELLVRALPSLLANFPSARLLLAGDGPCRARLEALAREHRLEDCVIFAGFIKEVSQVYAALDAFVFPSLAEPLGTSLLAAMAWGLPVVAVASGGVPEYVQGGVTGLVVARPDPNLFSAAMLQLSNAPELAERLAAAARRAIRERFTADKMVENTVRVYKNVLPLKQTP